MFDGGGFGGGWGGDGQGFEDGVYAHNQGMNGQDGVADGGDWTEVVRAVATSVVVR